MQENKVRGAIFSRYKSESDFARAIGWTKQRLNRYTNGIIEPSLSDVQAMAAGLNMQTSDLVQFFLEMKSPNGDEERSESNA